jgi:hypothetical protein
LKIDFEGREWDFEPSDDLDVKQAMVLHLAHGMTIAEYSSGIDGLDQRAYHFAYWLMLQQNGVVKPIAECNPKIVQFAAAVTEARIAEGKRLEAEKEAKAAAEDGKPGPTVPPPGLPAAPTGS